MPRRRRSEMPAPAGRPADSEQKPKPRFTLTDEEHASSSNFEVCSFSIKVKSLTGKPISSPQRVKEVTNELYIGIARFAEEHDLGQSLDGAWGSSGRSSISNNKESQKITVRMAMPRQDADAVSEIAACRSVLELFGSKHCFDATFCREDGARRVTVQLVGVPVWLPPSAVLRLISSLGKRVGLFLAFSDTSSSSNDAASGSGDGYFKVEEKNRHNFQGSYRRDSYYATMIVTGDLPREVEVVHHDLLVGTIRLDVQTGTYLDVPLNSKQGQRPASEGSAPPAPPAAGCAAVPTPAPATAGGSAIIEPAQAAAGTSAPPAPGATATTSETSVVSYKGALVPAVQPLKRGERSPNAQQGTPPPQQRARTRAMPYRHIQLALSDPVALEEACLDMQIS